MQVRPFEKFVVRERDEAAPSAAGMLHKIMLSGLDERLQIIECSGEEQLRRRVLLQPCGTAEGEDPRAGLDGIGLAGISEDLEMLFAHHRYDVIVLAEEKPHLVPLRY